jgi:hypothetical protein
MGMNAYAGVMGADNLFYMRREIDDIPLDMAIKRADVFQKLGEEYNALAMETLQYIRKLEVQEDWTFLP